MQLAAKDLGYALTAIDRDLPVAEAVLAARNSGLGDEHLVAVHKLYG